MMLSHMPSTAFRCIIPIEKPTLSSTAYHSPVDQPDEAAQNDTMQDHTRPFPAWPEIISPLQPLCLHTLMGATYFHHRSPITDHEEWTDLAKKYLTQYPDIIDSELMQDISAFLDYHAYNYKHMMETGKFPRWHALHTPTFRTLTSSLFSSIKKKGFHSAAAREVGEEVFLQSLVYGDIKNFYTPEEAFGWSHEFAHRVASWLHSGIRLHEQATLLHNALDSLMTISEVQQDDAIRFWKVFKQENRQLIHLANKFEPIEEIFATYIGLHLSPPEVKIAIKDTIEQELGKRTWYETYKVFEEACNTCQVNNRVGAATLITELTCRILEHTELDAISTLHTMIQIIKIIWKEIEITEKGETLDQPDKDAIHQALVHHIKHAGIPLDIWNALNEAGTPNLERLYNAYEHNFSRAEDQDLLTPLLLFLGRASKNEVNYFIYPEPATTDKILYFTEKIFLESIRQQLSSYLENSHQQWHQHCSLICPYDKKEQRCCGRNQKLFNLYNRLPEEYRTYFTPPSCKGIEYGAINISLPFLEGSIEKISYETQEEHLDLIIVPGDDGLLFSESDVILTKGTPLPVLDEEKLIDIKQKQHNTIRKFIISIADIQDSVDEVSYSISDNYIHITFKGKIIPSLDRSKVRFSSSTENVPNHGKARFPAQVKNTQFPGEKFSKTAFYKFLGDRILPVVISDELVIMPGIPMHGQIGKGKSFSAIEQAMKDNQEVLLISISKEEVEAYKDNNKPQNLPPIGVIARIEEFTELSDDTAYLITEGLERAEIIECVQNQPYYTARCQPRPDVKAASTAAETLMSEVQDLIEQIVSLLPEDSKPSSEALRFIQQIDQPGYLADAIIYGPAFKFEDRIDILNTLDVIERLHKVQNKLSHQLNWLHSQAKTQSKTNRSS